VYRELYGPPEDPEYISGKAPAFVSLAIRFTAGKQREEVIGWIDY